MSKSGKHSASQPVARRRARKVAAATVGMVLAGGSAFAVSNWVVGVNAGATGEGQSAAISNLTITAVATPAAGNLLFPGGSGDVVININNPNSFPVTVTGFNLPTNTTYATGYTTSALTSAVAGCASGTSLVGWAFATVTSGSAHTLTTPLTVAANTSNFTVTLTNDAVMAAGSPFACVNTFFSMPALTGIAATGGAATATASGGSDAWTS
ncbi:MAG: hypothetical protein QOI82_1862 [Actinomycetota bacterium]|jgi:hypothetical protein|nr:hypothetical protein [Actinomycetota bacterium]